MSRPLRVALAVEGPTDEVVLKAVIEAMVGDRPILFTLVQPEFSLGLQTGTGWGGLYRWCEQTRSEGGGRVSGSALFRFHDLVIIHLDADVAGKKYSDHNIIDHSGDLPCEQPCPPASDTTDALRQVLLRWLGEPAVPPKCVICMPSKNAETWMMAAFFPKDAVMSRKGWECYGSPGGRLASQPLKVRIKKTIGDYSKRAADLKARWPGLCQKLTQAERFRAEFEDQYGQIHDG